MFNCSWIDLKHVLVCSRRLSIRPDPVKVQSEFFGRCPALCVTLLSAGMNGNKQPSIPSIPIRNGIGRGQIGMSDILLPPFQNRKVLAFLVVPSSLPVFCANLLSLRFFTVGRQSRNR
uniref:Uncharacterized protein n=1 Tax=Ulva partita TaxID=1605170 RepID=A0A1C9ZWC9_9CHLO|nr:hypothetical protein [Ulva partita]